ncbi:Serine/threonine-protein kinase haspin [Pleurostoma richardsiae]|uniref:non-specific serine/threonine protein kinase n=1 Tax=Pleurostoma richardsiae TaxID=41990 RepID=A0AA38S0Y8_9PEZI|nr:Serine/threonine-protein kinase haspin [Pleurostoma richardsiae]
MARTTSVRTYGRQSRKLKKELILPAPAQSPPKKDQGPRDSVSDLTEKLSVVRLDAHDEEVPEEFVPCEEPRPLQHDDADERVENAPHLETSSEEREGKTELRVLTWADICPVGSQIEKIAEASYAEVYRIRNERGTSIIKAIRLQSPIKPQTKAQQKSELVDEEPHCEEDLVGELKISEWLADIPGFVVYKERYIVRGKTTPALLETHRTFHRRAKRKDPDRIQFYPSPSRYLDDTQFLVVELGDAGIALEDFELVSVDQLWDIFLLVAIALARAEDQIKFEHRDLHEGNLCIRQVSTPSIRVASKKPVSNFGYSGLDITILDYGLSRGEAPDEGDATPVAFDLERDLTLFRSTHAPQCAVYRQMRSFLLKGDRVHLPPKSHKTPYESGIDGPISWNGYYPYTNVLWLAYLYDYLTTNYRGPEKELKAFRQTTRELWAHLDPDAPRVILSFSSAVDVITFAVEAGWITEKQLMGDVSEIQGTLVDDESRNASIIEIIDTASDEAGLRRSPRRRVRGA